jgi:hypothetical protein
MAKNKTIEFIIKASLIHGDKYEYSKVNYTNSKEKVIIICKIHGEFEQRPECHINRKSGCPKCFGKYKLTNDEFIKKAITIHGDKYDYSKINYINFDSKIIIICKHHGEFEQSPNKHIIQKNGCPKCAIDKRANLRRKPIDKFINQSMLIHNNKYDYSKVEYKNSNTNVIIICKTHGEFLQTPVTHISGNGCNKCSGKYKPKTDEWIQKATLIHGDKYDYSKVEYKTAKHKVIIICKLHGEFKQIPNSHLLGYNCMKCTNNYNPTTEESIIKAKLIHGDKYDYSKVNYTNSKEKVIIICKIHGDFEQTMDSHINKHTECRKCSGNYIPTTEEFIQKAILIHGDKYNYSKVDYKNNRDKIIIICNKHGQFEQTPNNHIQKKGCLKCNLYLYSRAQIVWLNSMAFIKNIYIQHAENEGEYQIPTTKFKADGYCKETNTIYEYHGDYWHGNPKIYSSTCINNTTHCTFGELYESTVNKEKIIRELGFNLVTIWESDWIHFIRLIRKIQIKFKQRFYS